MDESKIDSHSSAWKIPRRSFEVNEDVVMGISNFLTIEGFLLVGGGKANNIHDNDESGLS